MADKTAQATEKYQGPGKWGSAIGGYFLWTLPVGWISQSAMMDKMFQAGQLSERLGIQKWEALMSLPFGKKMLGAGVD